VIRLLVDKAKKAAQRHPVCSFPINHLPSQPITAATLPWGKEGDFYCSFSLDTAGLHPYYLQVECRSRIRS
jgi:hypothetical protein